MGGSSPKETFTQIQRDSPGKGCWFLYNQDDVPIVEGGEAGTTGELRVVSAVADAEAPARRVAAWQALTAKENELERQKDALEAARAAAEEEQRKQILEDQRLLEAELESDRLAAEADLEKHRLAAEEAFNQKVLAEVKKAVIKAEGVIKTRMLKITRIKAGDDATVRIAGVQAAMNEIGNTDTCSPWHPAGGAKKSSEDRPCKSSVNGQPVKCEECTVDKGQNNSGKYRPGRDYVCNNGGHCVYEEELKAWFGTNGAGIKKLLDPNKKFSQKDIDEWVKEEVEKQKDTIETEAREKYERDTKEETDKKKKKMEDEAAKKKKRMEDEAAKKKKEAEDKFALKKKELTERKAREEAAKVAEKGLRASTKLVDAWRDELVQGAIDRKAEDEAERAIAGRGEDSLHTPVVTLSLVPPTREAFKGEGRYDYSLVSPADGPELGGGVDIQVEASFSGDVETKRHVLAVVDASTAMKPMLPQVKDKLKEIVRRNNLQTHVTVYSRDVAEEPEELNLANDAMGMKSGEVVALEKGVGGVRVTCSWASSAASGSVDLDSGIVLFEGDKLWDTCNYNKTEVGSSLVTLNTDARGTDENDSQEILICKLNKLPESVTTAVVYLCNYSGGTFANAEEVEIEVDDIGGILTQHGDDVEQLRNGRGHALARASANSVKGLNARSALLLGAFNRAESGWYFESVQKVTDGQGPTSPLMEEALQAYATSIVAQRQAADLKRKAALEESARRERMSSATMPRAEWRASKEGGLNVSTEIKRKQAEGHCKYKGQPGDFVTPFTFSAVFNALVEECTGQKGRAWPPLEAMEAMLMECTSTFDSNMDHHVTVIWITSGSKHEFPGGEDGASVEWLAKMQGRINELAKKRIFVRVCMTPTMSGPDHANGLHAHALTSLSFDSSLRSAEALAVGSGNNARTPLWANSAIGDSIDSIAKDVVDVDCYFQVRIEANSEADGADSDDDATSSSRCNIPITLSVRHDPDFDGFGDRTARGEITVEAGRYNMATLITMMRSKTKRPEDRPVLLWNHQGTPRPTSERSRLDWLREQLCVLFLNTEHPGKACAQYYWGRISEVTAVKALAGMADGSYLLRQDPQHPHPYILSVVELYDAATEAAKLANKRKAAFQTELNKRQRKREKEQREKADRDAAALAKLEEELEGEKQAEDPSSMKKGEKITLEEGIQTVTCYLKWKGGVELDEGIITFKGKKQFETCYFDRSAVSSGTMSMTKDNNTVGLNVAGKVHEDMLKLHLNKLPKDVTLALVFVSNYSGSTFGAASDVLIQLDNKTPGQEGNLAKVKTDNVPGLAQQHGLILAAFQRTRSGHWAFKAIQTPVKATSSMGCQIPTSPDLAKALQGYADNHEHVEAVDAAQAAAEAAAQAKQTAERARQRAAKKQFLLDKHAGENKEAETVFRTWESQFKTEYTRVARAAAKAEAERRATFQDAKAVAHVRHIVMDATSRACRTNIRVTPPEAFDDSFYGHPFDQMADFMVAHTGAEAQPLLARFKVGEKDAFEEIIMTEPRKVPANYQTEEALEFTMIKGTISRALLKGLIIEFSASWFNTMTKIHVIGRVDAEKILGELARPGHDNVSAAEFFKRIALARCNDSGARLPTFLDPLVGDNANPVKFSNLPRTWKCNLAPLVQMIGTTKGIEFQQHVRAYRSMVLTWINRWTTLLSSEVQARENELYLNFGGDELPLEDDTQDMVDDAEAKYKLQCKDREAAYKKEMAIRESERREVFDAEDEKDAKGDSDALARANKRKADFKKEEDERKKKEKKEKDEKAKRDKADLDKFENEAEDPSEMKAGERATLKQGIGLVTVVTKWSGNVDLDSGMIQYSGTSAREYVNHTRKGQPPRDGMQLNVDRVGGANQEEILTLNLQAVPASVTCVICHICSYNSQNFAAAKGLSIAIKDKSNGSVLCEAATSGSEIKSATGYLLGAFKRLPGGRWAFESIQRKAVGSATTDVKSGDMMKAYAKYTHEGLNGFLTAEQKRKQKVEDEKKAEAKARLLATQAKGKKAAEDANLDWKLDWTKRKAAAAKAEAKAEEERRAKAAAKNEALKADYDEKVDGFKERFDRGESVEMLLHKQLMARVPLLAASKRCLNQKKRCAERVAQLEHDLKLARTAAVKQVWVIPGSIEASLSVWERLDALFGISVEPLRAKAGKLDQLFAVASVETRELHAKTFTEEDDVYHFMRENWHPDILEDDGVLLEDVLHTSRDLFFRSIVDNDEIPFILAVARAWTVAVQVQLSNWIADTSSFAGAKLLHLLYHCDVLQNGRAEFTRLYDLWLSVRHKHWKKHARDGTGNKWETGTKRKGDVFYQLDDEDGSGSVDPLQWLKKKSSLPQLEEFHPVLREQEAQRIREAEMKRESVGAKATKEAVTKKLEAERKARQERMQKGEADAKAKAERKRQQWRKTGEERQADAARRRREAAGKTTFTFSEDAFGTTEVDDEEFGGFGDFPITHEAPRKPQWQIDRDNRRAAKETQERAHHTLKVSVALPMNLSFNQDPHDDHIFVVTQVKSGGNADRTKKISAGMRIMSVNGTQVAGLTKSKVSAMMRASNVVCHLEVLPGEGSETLAKLHVRGASGGDTGSTYGGFGGDTGSSYGGGFGGYESDHDDGVHSGVSPAKEEFKKKHEQKKSTRKKVGDWFNTLRRKKLQKGEQADDSEERLVMRTMVFGGDSDFESCKEGEKVQVIRELPDHTFVIRTREGSKLLHGDAFVKPRQDLVFFDAQ